VLIGVDMDKSAVLAALDGALMTDAEMAAGDAPDAWRKLEDPFFPVAAHDFNLATALGKQGDYAGALRHHTVALATRTEMLPAEHADIASSQAQVGIAHSDLENHTEALKHLKAALEIQWKALPADHPDIAETHTHLAIVHGSLNNNAERLRHNKAALAIQEKVLPANHPDLGIIHNNLGVAYSRLGTADMVLRRLSLISQLDAAVTPHTSRHMLCRPTHGA